MTNEFLLAKIFVLFQSASYPALFLDLAGGAYSRAFNPGYA
jgi:hypothetical protein